MQLSSTMICFSQNIEKSKSSNNNDLVVNGISLSAMKGIVKEHSLEDYLNNWLLLCSDDNSIYIFQKIKKFTENNEYLQIWIKRIPKKNKLLEYRQSIAMKTNDGSLKQKIINSLHYSMTLTVVDCKKDRIATKSTYLKDKNGVVLFSEVNNDVYEYNFEEAVPETIGERMVNTICEIYQKFGKRWD